MHQEGLQKAAVIGLEYSIERQTTKDIHLCLMAFQLFCDWLEFIWLFALPLFRGQESGGGAGHRDRLRPALSYAGLAELVQPLCVDV